MNRKTWREAGVTLEQIYARCTDDCGCMLWTGAHNHVGHPKIRNGSARRIVWEIKHGPIPAGKLVSVSCGRTNCLECLVLTTKAEAASKAGARADVKARKSASAARAARRSRAIITMEIAREIRASDELGIHIAQRLSVSPSLVFLVRLGKAWRETTASPFAGLMAP